MISTRACSTVRPIRHGLTDHPVYLGVALTALAVGACEVPPTLAVVVVGAAVVAGTVIVVDGATVVDVVVGATTSST